MKPLPTLLSALLVCSCGTYVPNLKPFPVKESDGIMLVQGITQSIECELRRAAVEVINSDKKAAVLNSGIRSAPWIESWGVQTSLTLSIVESSSFSAGADATLPTVADPSPNVVLGGSSPSSWKATRTGKLNYYYLVSDLYKAGVCAEPTVATLRSGSRLINSDLKISEWLGAQTFAAGTGAIPVSQAPNALTQIIAFTTTTGGSIKATVPAVSSKLSAINLSVGGSRAQTHSVTMTFGPADKSKTGLSGSAADAFLAAQIGSEVRRAQ